MNKITRNVGLDLLKIISIFTVVLIHTPYLELSYRNSCLNYLPPANACFALIAGWFLSLRDTFFVSAMKRVHRIFIPYIIWEFVYFIWGIIGRYLSSGKIQLLPAGVDWIDAIFFGGASGQLWFVSYLFYAQIVIKPMMVFFARRKAHAVLALFVSLSMILCHTLIFEEHIRSFLFLTGYCLFGSSVKLLLSAVSMTCVFRKFCIGLSIAIIVVSWMVAIPEIMRTCVWTCAFGLCVFPRGAISRMVPEISACSYGIYLCHHLVPECIVYHYLPTAAIYITNPYVLFLVTSCFMFLVPLGAVYACRKMPLFKKCKWIWGE